jgi:hypothetical protein
MILKELNTLQNVLIKDRQSKNKIKWTSGNVIALYFMSSYSSVVTDIGSLLFFYLKVQVCLSKYKIYIRML